MCRTRNLHSTVMIVSIATLFIGCGNWAYKSNLNEGSGNDNEIIVEVPSQADGEEICLKNKTTLLYEKSERFLSLKWKSRENLDQMFYVLHNIYREGLNPDDYHLPEIEILADKIILSEEADFADVENLELLLSNAFLELSSDMAIGRTDAETVDPQWNASRRILPSDWEKFIDSTLLGRCIFENMEKLTPRHLEYTNLKKALEQYHQIEERGGWGTFVTVLPNLEMEMCHPDIARLRNRLAITQGYFENNLDENLFDQLLCEQVKLFQLRNGLAPDGVVGKSTIEAMNITVEERIASIKANLERWRWLNDDLGDRYITVNIANFELQVIEYNSIVFSAKVIVGRNLRKTPVFSSLMTYLVLNPTWTVPPTILNTDIIPSVIANPDYLAEKNLKILKDDGTEVDPLSIDWGKAVSRGFPYRIHQASGPENALGRVKFMFPNKYSVYIHDTPNRSQFRSTDRSFSSGCIRVNNYLDLAACLMKDDPAWTTTQIKRVIDQGQERTVILPKPIKVHIVYFTAWAGDDGIACFRKDIYKLDQPLLIALK